MALKPDRMRISVAIPRDLYPVLQEFADAGGMSVSRIVGEWLNDTRESLQFVTARIVEAKQSPASALAKFQEHALAQQALLKDAIGLVPAAEPPACNTGVTSPSAPRARQRKAPALPSGFSPETIKDYDALMKRTASRQRKADPAGKPPKGGWQRMDESYEAFQKRLKAGGAS